MPPSPDKPHYQEFAYADPPYPGCCRLYGHRHEAPYGCWDDLATHRALIDRLGFDYPHGWALSTSASALQDVIALCPAKIRVCAWTKPMSAMFVNSLSVQYSWEPVLVMGGRDRRGRNPVVRDWLAASPEGYTWRERPPDHVIGGKPPAFCRWVSDLLGYLPGDQLIDVFPGSGTMGRVLAQGRLL